MKRWIFSVVAMLAAGCLLAGCGIQGPDNAAKPVTDGFSCLADIRYHELELQAQLSRQTDGKLLLAFTLPKTLQGVVLGWNGSAMTMEMGGMGVTVPTDRVPQGALIQRLLQVLSASPQRGSVSEEGYVMNGEIDGEAYTLVCDAENGLPSSLSLPSEELEVVFSDCKLLQDTTVTKS